MRLLNTTTKQLESFCGKDIPGYAILSHTWGKEEDEVLFKHIAGSDHDQSEGEQRRGYKKVVDACKQAIEDKWEYIWIDTCCIDRDNSAELSEAINSMYEWYRNAGVCYVHLEDVRSGVNVRGSSNIIGRLKHSKWFSRGWTLQELIAPRSVVFYTQDWVEIGTKASLRDTISNITGIRVEMIISYNPKETSIAERMSWAARRETTRVEDAAYCLMGLFGVHMTLLYGEGQKAFMRLQEEIMKVSDDHSLFAWTSFGSDPRGLLADSPQEFQGAGDVILGDDEGAYSAYSITNKGLEIELPLLPMDSKDLTRSGLDVSRSIFKAVLKCTYRKQTPTLWVIIYLEKVREGHYVRTLCHALGRMYTHPKDLPKPTPLVVTQINADPNYVERWRYAGVSVKVDILPTESEFTFEDCSLVEGYSYYISSLERPRILVFDRQEEHFGVVIGDNDGVAWLDVIKEIEPENIPEIRSSFENGGSRHDAVVRRCDRLSIEISNGWLVVVSARMVGHKDDYFPVAQPYVHIRAVIQIQKVSN